MDETFEYDVIINYGLEDTSDAQDLAERLKKDGLRVWFDATEVVLDDILNSKIQQGLEASRTLILLISSKIITTEWVQLERNTALFRDPTHYRRRFIPLRLDKTDMPESLKKFAYIDWRQKSDEEYERLLIACQPLVSETSPTKRGNRRSTGKPAKELEGHRWGVLTVALTPIGQLAASGGNDSDVHVWDMISGDCLTTLSGHTASVTAVAITSDGKRIGSGSYDTTARIWSLDPHQRVAILRGHTGSVTGIDMTDDGQRVITSSEDGTLRIWNLHPRRCIGILNNSNVPVSSLAVTKDKTKAVSGGQDGKIRIWDLNSQKCISVLSGHTGKVTGVAVIPSGELAVSCSTDRTLMVWNLSSGTALATLEGHHSSVTCLAITPDGKLAVSGSMDRTVRIWDLATGNCINILEWHNSEVSSVAISADGRSILFGYNNNYIILWKLRSYRKVSDRELTATRYTNAKVLLVGESGVGKTGLAYRLTENCFVPSISSDAVWATQMKLPHESQTSDIEREIWLWDFAGQADYRLVHQLYMDETALAVLVFNPQSENPFEGLGQWDGDLQRAARRSFSKLLVAGRCDRGGLMISNEGIERFCKERGFDMFLETSALTGAGCSELHDAIIHNIRWEEIPWTASPQIFKLLKDEIVKLKDEGKVLLRVSELKQQIEMRLPRENFLLDHLRAVIGLLAGPGVVWQLEFGDFVLLQPERINSYAAAVIRSVRAHTDEIGCISEERVLTGDLDYQDMERLPTSEEQIILRAMHHTFINRGLCLREHTDSDALLIFPSYFRRERPELEDHPAAFVTYQFSGQLDEIYATLVVRLHHTPTFDKDQLWRFAADFKTPQGKRVGLKMTKKIEGAAEITVYMDPDIPDDTKVTFIRYIHDHLKAKDLEVVRIRHYVCPFCYTPAENHKAIQDRLSRGLKDILCVNCEERILLWDLIEDKFASSELQQLVRKLEEQSRLSIDNESRELILVGHAFSIAGEAGQIFRPIPNSDWGIDGEIEFKNDKGQASGQRIYLQLKSGDSYLYNRKRDGKEIFSIKNPRHRDYWQAHQYPVMLVIRTSDGQIRWMNVSDYFKGRSMNDNEVIFNGEPFTALNVLRLRDSIFIKRSPTK